MAMERSELRRVIDGKRSGEKVNGGLRRFAAADRITRLEREDDRGNDVIAAAEAPVAGRIVATRGVGDARIGEVAGGGRDACGQ